MPELQPPEQLDQLATFIDGWLGEQLDENPVVVAVERAGADPRWFVRVTGDAKDVFSIRFELQQRTLAYETYVMPAPEENQAELYAHLLRRNSTLFGASFAIGEEDAIFLRGKLHNELVTADGELDRVLGSLYVWVEQFFPTAIRIGFASKFS